MGMLSYRNLVCAMGLLAGLVLASPSVAQPVNDGTASGTGTTPGPSDMSADGTGQGTSPARIDLSALEVVFNRSDSSAHVGDVIAVEASFTLPPDVELFSFEPGESGHLQFLAADVSSAVQTDGSTHVSTVSRFTAYRPGNHQIESFVVRVTQPDGFSEVLTVPGIGVEIARLTADEVDPNLRTEKGGVVVRYNNYTVVWVAGISAGILAFGLIGFFIVRNRPKVSAQPPPPPPRSPHVVALEELNAIVDDQLVEKGLAMEFAVRLSEALREYFGAVYLVDTIQMTTTEIVRHLRGENLPAQVDLRMVGRVLYRCDLIKFAKYEPHQTETEAALKHAFDIVHKTMAASTAQSTQPESGSVDVRANHA